MYEEIEKRFYSKGEYKTTSNSSIYNKLHKEQHASCSYCSWHSRTFGHHNENDSWDWYVVDEDPNPRNNRTKYPNWKLCSKNKKQWMKKPLKFVDLNYDWCDHPFYRIEW